MEYYTNDYLRTGTNINGVQNASAPGKYSGLINGIGWQTQVTPSNTVVDPSAMNIYTYDTKGQLLSNIWGTPDYATKVFTGTANVNQEKGISYDGHGNLLKLQRTNGAGTLVNNFTYNYQAGTNKLSSVTGYATYTYDSNGQLASQVKGTVGMYLDYDVSGKVTSIYSDAAKSVIMLSFAYDEGGNRIMKKDHRTNAVTWYSYNDAGTLLAVFESKNGGALQLIEQPVYGSDRLGMLNRLGGNYSYTLTDHLGNTRAIINRNKLPGGFADVQYNADYYPYGMEARSAGIDSRYGYQGLYAEKDKETGWNNFELRNYDPAVGRWLTMDPMGQYISPYVGMGNNPVSMFDPSGGWSDGGPGKIAWTVKLNEVVVNARKSVFNSSFVKSLRNFQTNASAWAQRQSDITTQMSRTFAYVTQSSRDHIRGTLTPLYQIYGTMVSMGGGQAGYTRGWIGFSKGVEVVENVINTVEEVKIIENVHVGAMQGLRSFSGTEKAMQSGATPNSIYTYLSKDGKAVSNYIYNGEGKVIYQVDFGKHGKFLSGHGHEMLTPGELGSGHTNHIPWNDVPSEYLKIPNGVQYSVPPGAIK
ncbi:RHS repeat domain-containing protein [Sphingobacterium sp. UBA1498]|uniref:RHS repeat domain-containing protein n=1 Tax=Sphingobacterium sp. UBA1498 TaxID=1947481 RepID=UPI0025E51AD2|nr:RHS repeat-associated core domain-containing protein [Sphingobacterium sp. UBA1498]